MAPLNKNGKKALISSCILLLFVLGAVLYKGGSRLVSNFGASSSGPVRNLPVELPTDDSVVSQPTLAPLPTQENPTPEPTEVVFNKAAWAEGSTAITLPNGKAVTLECVYNGEIGMLRINKPNLPGLREVRVNIGQMLHQDNYTSWVAPDSIIWNSTDLSWMQNLRMDGVNIHVGSSIEVIAFYANGSISLHCTAQ